MDYDENKVDEVVLALMNLTLHDEIRAWKGFDFRVLDRLYEKGFIRDPKNRARSDKDWPGQKSCSKSTLDSDRAEPVEARSKAVIMDLRLRPVGCAKRTDSILGAQAHPTRLSH
jgi:Domain of unknown function (DUF6429)